MRAGDLSGFRGVRPAAIQDAYVGSEIPGTPEAEMADKYRRMLLGVAAEKAQAGMAEGNDNSQVLGALISHAEDDAMAAMRELLSIDDLSSAPAREAHYAARVAAGVVSYVNDMIRDGIRASIEITEEQTEGRGL